MNLDDVLLQASLTHPRFANPLHLSRHQAKVYSQNGEDGMIAEIFRRVGMRDKIFAEFGIGKGVQNNTRLLLESGWRGVWFEGSDKNVAAARTNFSRYIEQGRLKVVEASITRENINELWSAAGLPEAVDFASVDIDYNTGHVWEALQPRARVACIEYNASIPAALDAAVPYDPQGKWDGTNWFGHGLKALERIGRAKDMALVGCDLAGVNAFFVAASEVGDRFVGPFTAEAQYEAPKYSVANWRFGHPSSAQSRRWVVQD